MKPTSLLRSCLKPALLAASALITLLTAQAATTIGLNFQTDYGPGDTYNGKPVTAAAFGIEVTNWFNLIGTSGNVETSTNQTITLNDGSVLKLTWRAKNAYTSSINATDETNVVAGVDEVLWGYLDDTSPGYSVTISGLRGFASNFQLLAIAASDNATGFGNVSLVTKSLTNAVDYTNDPAQFFQVGAAAWATSTVSTVYVTETSNDSITLTGAGRSGSIRSTLAGILFTYTPGTNAPLVETDPKAPTNVVFSGQSFSLTAVASGSAPLAYQWRKGGTPIPDATNLVYTKTGVTTADSASYDLVITNLLGAVTSQVAAVTISPVAQPVITSAPLSQSRYPGYDAVFTVAATGGQLEYLWKKGATVITGATNSSLTVSNVSAADAATYTVTVSNPVSSVSASATLSLVTPGTYDGAVAGTRPQVYLRFGEAGPLTQDLAANLGSLGNAGRGLYRQGAVHPAAGALGAGSDTAVQLSGSANVLVPFTAGLNTATFTAEGWFKPAAALTGTTLTSPFSAGDFGNPRAGWLIYQTATNWNVRFYNQVGTAFTLDMYGGPVPVVGTWYHLAVTFDGITASLFVNGQLAVSGTPTGFVPGVAGGLGIGMRADSTFFWAGAADEIAVYSTALDASRILTHYQTGTNATPANAYPAEIAADAPTVYLRLGEPAFAPVKAVNLGVLGPVRDGAYTPLNAGVGGDLGLNPGTAGPRPTAFPGLESTNTAVQMTNGYVNVDPLNFNTNAVTIVCWIKRSSVQRSHDLFGLVFERSAGNASDVSGLHMMPDGELRYHWNNGQYTWASNLRPPADQWAFVALVVQPTQATIYMDDGTGIVSAVNTATHAVSPFTGAFHVGNDNATRYFSGEIDEVAIYNRSLSVGEISLLALSATGRPVTLQLVSGGIIQDVKPVGAPNHGTARGSTFVASTNDFNARTRTGVRQFTAAAGDQIVIPASPDFNSPTGTITFWMLANAPIPGPGSDGAILFDRRTTSGDVLVLDDFGALFVQARTNGASANTFSVGYLPDGNWRHVAYVYDQSPGGSISIYVDGVLAGSNPNTAGWLWPTNQPIELGRSHDGYWKRFDGLMDDFRFYNRVLNATEIGQIYASDANVDTAAMKVRLDFNNAFFGKSLLWQYGTLESTPAIGAGAVWSPVPAATSPYGFLPEASGTNQFFRARVP